MPTNRAQKMIKAYRSRENYTAAIQIEANCMAKIAIVKAQKAQDQDRRVLEHLAKVQSQKATRTQSLIDALDLEILVKSLNTR